MNHEWNIANKLKSFLSDDEYCALYARNKDAVFEVNKKMTKMFAVLGASLMGLMLLMTFVFDYLAQMRSIYAPTFCAYLVGFGLAYAKTESKLFIRIAFYYILLVSYILGVMLGVVYNPNVNANLVNVFILVIPLLFIERPMIMSSLLIALSTIFCVLAYEYKPLSIFKTDITNCFVTLVISSVTMRVNTMLRVENLDSKRRLTEENMTDFVTGLKTRRAFDQAMLTNRSILAIKEARISIFLIDIDLFKPYMDIYGHVQGDECLKKIGGAFNAIEERSPVMFFRYSNALFAAMSLGDTVNMNVFGNELIRLAQELAIPNDASPFGFVTFSVGGADSESARVDNDIDLLNCADKALYEAKLRGKNRYCRYVPQDADTIGADIDEL